MKKETLDMLELALKQAEAAEKAARETAHSLRLQTLSLRDAIKKAKEEEK